tara:strand:+ start:119 stop:298 length:180 start_codon:yes stop_codon:yes gene_type:complete
MRDNPHTMNELNNQKFLALVESLLSEKALQYGDIQGTVDWGLRNDWSAEEVVEHIELDV